MTRKNRPRIFRPDNLNCWDCVDRWYFSMVMQLDTPAVYLDATKAKELAKATLPGRLQSVRTAGGLS